MVIFYCKPNGLKDFQIVIMEEHKSYILVSEEFKDRCEQANLRGINFLGEGYSIYTDL